MRRSLLALLALTFAAPAAAQRTPYLQRLTPTEVTVVWRDASGAGAVCYGTALDTLDQRASATTAGGQHEAILGGLTPQTQYFYATTDGGACPAMAEPNDTFTTAPMAGTNGSFRVWVVGDSGTGGSRQAAVRDAMLAYVGPTRPDLFLHVGDMAYADGTDAEFTDNFYSMYAGVLRNTTCFPALGNHEGHSADSATQTGPYYEGYVLPTDGRSGGLASGTEAYYSFDYANVHFVVLDSHDSPREPDGTMLTWLEADLSATDATWIVSYWHHPPYTKGSHDSDRESQLIQMRENALPILEAHGVDLVLGGHSHIYERSHLVGGAYDTPTTAAGHIVDSGDGALAGDGPYDANAGAVYIVAGHGGTGVRGVGDHPLMYFSELDHGSVILDVAGLSMTVRNIRHDGVVSDQLTMVKGDEDTLVLVSPRGGESIAGGDPLSVRWAAPDDTTSLLIEMTVDGGESWLTVDAAADNDGIYEFATPAVRTDVARIRISDADRPDRVAESGDFALVNTRELEPLPFGGEWEYHDGPTAPSGDWTTTPGDWPRGNAQLGYGDGDETTELMDVDPNIPTVYFRQTFSLGGAVTSAELDVLFDDGIAVFVNGVEVLGINVEDGLLHDTYASGSSDDNERASTMVDGALFEVGENVVAALVKQSSAGSSDVSFDLRLRVSTERDLPFPDGSVALPDGGEIFRDASVGPERDGGTPDDDSGDGGGCGCTTTGTPLGGMWPLALALVGLRRRR